MRPNILTPQSTQTKTTAISSGHSSSAYSLAVLSPIKSVTTAKIITSIYSQK